MCIIIVRVKKGWHLACAAWSAAVGREEMPEGEVMRATADRVVTIVLLYDDHIPGKHISLAHRHRV